MTDGWDAVRAIGPALGFLLAGVPLAALLDRLGFFAAAADFLQQRVPRLPVLALWGAAAGTTVVLNLDTTIVLLTPLYVRLARRAEVDPLPLALVPLVLAGLASSVLPVSNLTTLIAADRLGLGVGDVVGNLALPSLVAVVVGWLAYRRIHPRVLVAGPTDPVDRRALAIGAVVVAGLLVAFTVGPGVGVDPWMAAVAADVVLVAVTRTLPWRDLPVATAVGVAAVAAVVATAVDPGLLDPLLRATQPIALAGVTAAGAVVANAVNNIPATLLAVDGTRHATPGLWAWLLGVDAGAVLLPIGALANLLWRRVLRTEGIRVTVGDHVRAVWPIAVPALAAAAVAHSVIAAAR
ncbi:MAG: Citrate transporter [Acidimicrobiales bacterium]|nr:Citrate transporter [Acidimicrobiales bacterium]